MAAGRLGVAVIFCAISAMTLCAQSDVFVVGRDSATSDLIKPFKATHVALPTDVLDMEGRRDLMRGLLAEMGFAMRALPLGAPGIVLHANGRMEPGNDELQTRLYKKGVAVGQGERFQVTKLQFGADRLIFDINGGPYPPHRWLSHVQIGMNGASTPMYAMQEAPGGRVVLLFEGPVPKLTPAEVKLLLEPVLSFGSKSSSEAFAQTLPEPVRLAVEQHEVLVGMSRRMVQAALGQPAMKVREHADGGMEGEVLEEWIYGKVPETMRFIRFRGDRVVMLKVAAMGKPVEIRDKDEMAGYREPANEKILHLGDVHGEDAEGQAAGKPPTLLEPAPAAKPAAGTTPGTPESAATPRFM